MEDAKNSVNQEEDDDVKSDGTSTPKSSSSLRGEDFIKSGSKSARSTSELAIYTAKNNSSSPPNRKKKNIIRFSAASLNDFTLAVYLFCLVVSILGTLSSISNQHKDFEPHGDFTEIIEYDPDEHDYN